MKKITIQLTILIQLLILLNMGCNNEEMLYISKESQFYSLIENVAYTLSFSETEPQMLAYFHSDSSVDIKLPGSTGRERFKGKWFLSDSILIVDLMEVKAIDCLTGDELTHSDSIPFYRLSWKILTIDSTMFTCALLKRKTKPYVTGHRIQKEPRG